jgi:hypothetical protein
MRRTQHLDVKEVVDRYIHRVPGLSCDDRRAERVPESGSVGFPSDIFFYVFSAVKCIVDGAVPGASAKVTFEAKWQILFLVFCQTRRSHDHARCAIAALERLGIEERLLNGMQMAVRAQPIDGGDFAVRRAKCRDQAAMYRLTI